MTRKLILTLILSLSSSGAALEVRAGRTERVNMSAFTTIPYTWIYFDSAEVEALVCRSRLLGFSNLAFGVAKRAEVVQALDPLFSFRPNDVPAVRSKIGTQITSRNRLD